jgi:HEAT repeats
MSAAIALVLLCALMTVATFTARFFRLRANAHKQSFNARWEPYLFARMAGENIAAPPLARRDRILFLMLWLRFTGYVKDEASDALTEAARELGMEAYAGQLIRSWRTSNRVVGLSAVALLANPDAVARLPAIAKTADARLSYIATEALLRADPAEGLIALHRALNTRDWFPAAMAQMIRPHGAPAFALVEAAVREADPLHTRRLVRLVEGLGDMAAMPILRERLPLAKEPEEIAAIMHALGRMGSFDDRALVLAQIHSSSWLVRMESARALGRIGLKEDISTLISLARDRSWWVRYRAAGALHALAGGAALSAHASVERDAFARQMLLHVLAEQAK